MATTSIENNLNFWLVTQPDGCHYIMGAMSADVPHKAKVEDETTHEMFDAWEVEECVMIIPISNRNLPHYLWNHSWDDEPMGMISMFFPANTSSVTCSSYSDFKNCWRFNYTHSLLACSTCLFSRCKRLKIYKDSQNQK